MLEGMPAPSTRGAVQKKTKGWEPFGTLLLEVPGVFGLCFFG